MFKLVTEYCLFSFLYSQPGIFISHMARLSQKREREWYSKQMTVDSDMTLAQLVIVEPCDSCSLLHTNMTCPRPYSCHVWLTFDNCICMDVIKCCIIFTFSFYQKCLAFSITYFHNYPKTMSDPGDGGGGGGGGPT